MSTDAISPLRQRMIEDMSARKLNPHTQRSHISSCKRFTAYLKRSPDTATADEIRLFQLHLAETGTSICNRNRIMTGLRFLFRVTLRRLDLAAEIYHIKEPQKIPLVMSPDEAKRLLAMAGNLKNWWRQGMMGGKGDKAASVLGTKTSRHRGGCCNLSPRHMLGIRLFLMTMVRKSELQDATWDQACYKLRMLPGTTCSPPSKDITIFGGFIPPQAERQPLHPVSPKSQDGHWKDDKESWTGTRERHSKDAKFQTKYQLLRLKRKPEIPTSIPTIAAGTRSWMHRDRLPDTPFRVSAWPTVLCQRSRLPGAGAVGPW